MAKKKKLTPQERKRIVKRVHKMHVAIEDTPELKSALQRIEKASGPTVTPINRIPLN